MIALRESWRMLSRSRSRSVLLFLALSVLLLISSQLMLGLQNSQRLLSVLFRTVPVDVYLDLPGDADLLGDTRLTRLLEQVDSLEQIELLRVLSPQAAAGEFSKAFGCEVESMLGENPFPATLELSLRLGGDTSAMQKELSWLATQPGVSEVRSDTQLLGDLGARLHTTLVVLLALTALLLLIIVFLVRRGLTSQLEGWRPEMELLALWGAPPLQLQLPFLLVALQQALWPVPLVTLLLWGELLLARSVGFHLQMSCQPWLPLALLFLLQLLVWPVVSARVRRCYRRR